MINRVCRLFGKGITAEFITYCRAGTPSYTITKGPARFFSFIVYYSGPCVKPLLFVARSAKQGRCTKTTSNYKKG